MDREKLIIDSMGFEYNRLRPDEIKALKKTTTYALGDFRIQWELFKTEVKKDKIFGFIYRILEKSVSDLNRLLRKTGF